MRRPASPALIVTALYCLAAVFMTWPLVTVMHREVAWDMGDPLFNCWVLKWTGGQVLQFLGGDMGAWANYWDGNIFFPEPRTIAYSDHLFAQMVQILPVLAATDNVVLCYNLLFLSTFVLSGLGTFLLVRELTGHPLAAFVAGLAFAFAPYRIAQFSHVQVLSSQWMPFALYAFRRYFVTGRTRPLVGGSAALVAQHLSNGYYMLFFTPFAAAYCLYEMASRRRIREWRLWRSLGVAAVGVALLTVPFVLPYFEARQTAGVGVRSAGEIVMFSADTHAFATISSAARLWGQYVTGLKRDEGEGFPGATILTLAILGVCWGTRRAWRASGAGRPELPAWRQLLGGTIGVALMAYLSAVTSFLVMGRLDLSALGTLVRYRDAEPFIVLTLVFGTLLILVVPRLRQCLSGVPGSAFGFFAGAVVVAAALSLGPVIAAGGVAISAGPYRWLAVLPGFDGLRVPARYLMLVALFLAVLAGFGASALLARWRRAGTVFVGACALCILAESWTGRFSTNVRMAAEGLDLTPRNLQWGRDLDPVYQVVSDLRERVVLIEFPFGNHAWDIQTMFYAGYHRRPLVNGFSGFFSEEHRRRDRVLSRIPTDWEVAWKVLFSTGATHAIVHEAAFPEGRQQEISRWILQQGGREMMRNGTNVLFRLR